jgi:hypothetical protein
VIGIAIDKFYLDAVAQAGGTGSSMIADNTDAVNQFETSLENIVNSYMSCNS